MGFQSEASIIGPAIDPRDMSFLASPCRGCQHEDRDKNYPPCETCERIHGPNPPPPKARVVRLRPGRHVSEATWAARVAEAIRIMTENPEMPLRDICRVLHCSENEMRVRIADAGFQIPNAKAIRAAKAFREFYEAAVGLWKSGIKPSAAIRMAGCGGTSYSRARRMMIAEFGVKFERRGKGNGNP